jgi:hypothetical protein
MPVAQRPATALVGFTVLSLGWSLVMGSWALAAGALSAGTFAAGLASWHENAQGGPEATPVTALPHHRGGCGGRCGTAARRRWIGVIRSSAELAGGETAASPPLSESFTTFV